MLCCCVLVVFCLLLLRQVCDVFVVALLLRTRAASFEVSES